MALHAAIVVLAISLVTIEANESAKWSHSRADHGYRIVGGRDADISDYPYQVMVEYYAEGNQPKLICGGSILSETYVLTSAACLLDFNETTPLEKLAVRAGTSTPSSGGQVVRMLAYNIHPDYRENGTFCDYDMAIPKVQTLSFGNTIKPVALPTGSEISDGIQVQITGYGYAGHGVLGPSPLQVLDVKISKFAECKKIYSSIGNVLSDHVICAGVEGGRKGSSSGDTGNPLISKGVQYGSRKGSAFLDRGSPLVYKGVQYGIASWSSDYLLPDYPGIYTSVVSLRSYITKITGL